MQHGVVFYGENFVEVPEENITLKDICSSFGIACDSTSVCIKNRVSGRIVATLPFECLPDASTLRGDEDNTYDLVVTDTTESDEPTTDDMAGILKRLVQLGAVSLLTTHSEQQVEADVYDPLTSPGLLTRVLYPPSIYSPYRHCGDPVSKSAAQRQMMAARLAAGAPYVSSVEPYVVEEATKSALLFRTDLVVCSKEEET